MWLATNPEPQTGNQKPSDPFSNGTQKEEVGVDLQEPLPPASLTTPRIYGRNTITMIIPIISTFITTINIYWVGTLPNISKVYAYSPWITLPSGGAAAQVVSGRVSGVPAVEATTLRE